MIDLTVEATVPNALKAAWSIWSSASRLYGSVKCRRRELEALLEYCQDVLQQIADYTTKNYVTSDIRAAITHIEDAFESVKDLVTLVAEKGSLWSLMNAAKLDDESTECERGFERIYGLLSREILLPKEREIRQAREYDQRSLDQIIPSCKNGDELLLAIQKQERIHRTGEEIFVALRRVYFLLSLYTQSHPPRGDARPEDTFIHKAFEILRVFYNIGEDVVFRHSIISSLEVDFNVKHPIGQGASGKVYEGTWNGTTVAIKRLHAEDSQMLSQEQKQQFSHELRIWFELHHRNILPFYGACLEAEIPFLVMKYCPFGTVDRYLERYPDADRLKLSRSVAAGLEYLHSCKIVHANIKGANVLIDDNHDAFLGDFGLALKLHEYRSQASFSMGMDRRPGTLEFMAPEVLGGARPYTASDVYSLGLTIWQMFSDGKVPYANFLHSNVLIEKVVGEGHRETRPERMTQDHVWELLQKCWATKPNDRPTAKDVLKLLTPSDITVPTVKASVSMSAVFAQTGKSSMVDLTVEATVPNSLKAAFSIWSSAARLYGSVKYRWRELGVLLEYCQDVLQQVADYTAKNNVTSDVRDVITHIEDAFETVRDLVTLVEEKGFLWSLMNSAKLDDKSGECEGALERIYGLSPHEVLVQKEREISQAREYDQKSLDQIIASCKNSDELLLAIQKQERTHRTGEEIYVALQRYTQSHPPRGNVRPEDAFIHKVSEMLGTIYDVGGNVLFEHFRVSSLEVDFNVNHPIGQGASGKVYKGTWNGAPVAIKRMHAEDGRMLSREQKQEFYHELRAWSELRHPNVLPFYGVCLEAEIPFLLTKYCSLGTMDRYVAKHRDADRMKLAHSVASGLAYLHSQNIIHADIKGPNVLIGEDHDALLSDFGLALRLHEYRSQTSFSIKMDRRRGTPAFMAPEVLQGTTKPNEASDVYSLGLTIWQMFSDGQVPYANFYNSNRLIERVVDDGYREARPVRMTEDYMWDLVQKCWAAKPNARPTAQDVVRVLARSRVTTTRTGVLSSMGTLYQMVVNAVRTNLFTNVVFERKDGSAASSSSNNANVLDAFPNPIQKTEIPRDLARSDNQDAQEPMMTLRSELLLVSDVDKGSGAVYKGSDVTYKEPSDNNTGWIEDNASRSRSGDCRVQ
ncbi:hypothetical protein NM688_g2522 [Phlebia brevispora]|uniref:Uncharacterized protein n=1 Tax=Phlebia brevispora TaxID=194682 RepID=A0ACC1T8H1_9APHY|nr:hypothetical protein NM688_g2522 [Phlebia brevispora]